MNTMGGESSDDVDVERLKSELTETQSQLRSVCDQLSGILEIAEDAVISIDNRQKILLFNHGAERIFGYSAEEVRGQPLDILLPGSLRESHRHHVARFGHSSEHSRMMGERGEIKGRRKDGTVFPAEASISKATLAGGEMFFTAILRDITERKRAEEELEQSREELRELAAHLVSVREEERKRIAREVHDELGQALTVLRMGLFWLRNLPCEQAVQAHQKIDELLETTSSTMTTVRRISTELRPAMLDSFGLKAALEWQAQEFEKHSGIECVINISEGADKLPADSSMAVFRIFQEALTNVGRHAEASSVQAALSPSNGGWRLEVVDNGKGFDVPSQHGKRSLGLVGMRERALHLGGSFEVESTPGQGTRVSAWVPGEGKGTA